MNTSIFINKVEASGIITIDLLDYKPEIEIITLDIKEHLFMGMIVKEKEFKESISEKNFSIYNGKAVAVICSEDAIIPPWAYMMLVEKLYLYAVYVDLNTPENILLDFWKKSLLKADLSQYKDQKVVVKARTNIDPALYLLVSLQLKPLVKSLMYGEAGMPKVIFKN